MPKKHLKFIFDFDEEKIAWTIIYVKKIFLISILTF